MIKTKSFAIGLFCLMAATLFANRVAAQDIYVNYYTPQFYQDYLVFYDEDGTPIYYDADQAYSVPEDYPYYNELIQNYQDNLDAYYRWFEEVGYANMTYRRPLYTDYYKPRYYQDYPVFFDNSGRPFYYLDGRTVFVPAADPLYARFVRHYRSHRDQYRRWQREQGRNFHWYRRPIFTSYYNPLYFNGYVVFYDPSGAPYYYNHGQVMFIPRNHKRYRHYTDYYRSHRSDYDRWYRESGNRRHDYRRPEVYRKRHRNTHAPQTSHGRAVDRRYRPSSRGHDLRPVQPGHRDPVLRPTEPRHDSHDRRPLDPRHEDRDRRPPEPRHDDRGRQPQPGDHHDRVQPREPDRRPLEPRGPTHVVQPREPNRPVRDHGIEPKEPTRPGRDRGIQPKKPTQPGREHGVQPNQPRRPDNARPALRPDNRTNDRKPPKPPKEHKDQNKDKDRGHKSGSHSR